ncbi:hypothetical protein [Streptomyces solicathayae]|uniref:Uncharacterized protein n=1 Tax=Streptomyces solicathayae TaxID=3081768 RepID=A0ABZ0LPL6_9ACTN|nr:hypothetical protein [Streptomyces sp. HUAS YS2]WOX21446.1 hypothetical protein R2D22_08580 [Streptomyces sp. HUAS YS2]
MTDSLLSVLRERPRLAELAAFPFNFDLARADHGEEVVLVSGASLEPIAGDDTGGTYFLCDGTAVLYASSEGEAGLLGESVTDALEILIGLPGWWDVLHPDADAREAVQLPYAPELDTMRAELRAGLGLPERSPEELLARLHGTLLRTEPGYVLLNAEEGLAYELLDDLPRPTLREQVLAAGLPDKPELGELPDEGDEFGWVAVAARAGLTAEARIRLIRLLDDTGPDAVRLRRIVEGLEAVGDPGHAARAQRLFLSLQDTALARGAASRILARLERLAGDHAAARRALDRAVTALDAPPLPPSVPPVPGQEELGLGLPEPVGDTSAQGWRRRGTGRMVAEEFLRLALAEAEAGRARQAREALDEARALLDGMTGPNGDLGDLSRRAAWAVQALPRTTV